MQYAIVDGERIEAEKGKRGFCVGCNEIVIAKCGTIKINHWAHLSLKKKCDSWWENETLWHREWKEKFPERWREITFYDEKLQEFHRADVHTEKGITIEFQNSSFSIQELQSRERFYPKLIWVINGLKFRGFKILKSIPNPLNPLLNDFEFCDSDHLSMIRKIDALAGKPRPEILNFYSDELKNIPTAVDFYSLSWNHSHRSWLGASCPVFMDFGGQFLYRLRKRHQISKPYFYLQLISKKAFLGKYSC